MAGSICIIFSEMGFSIFWVEGLKYTYGAACSFTIQYNTKTGRYWTYLWKSRPIPYIPRLVPSDFPTWKISWSIYINGVGYFAFCVMNSFPALVNAAILILVKRISTLPIYIYKYKYKYKYIQTTKKIQNMLIIMLFFQCKTPQMSIIGIYLQLF